MSLSVRRLALCAVLLAGFLSFPLPSWGAQIGQSLGDLQGNVVVTPGVEIDNVALVWNLNYDINFLGRDFNGTTTDGISLPNLSSSSILNGGSPVGGGTPGLPDLSSFLTINSLSGSIGLLGTYVDPTTNNTGVVVALPGTGGAAIGTEFDTYVGAQGAESQLVGYLQSGDLTSVEQFVYGDHPGLLTVPVSLDSANTDITLVGFSTGHSLGSGSVGFGQSSPVPEPASATLVLVGAACLVGYCGRRRGDGRRLTTE